MILRNMFSMSGLNVAKAVASLFVSTAVAGAVPPAQYGLVAFSLPFVALLALLTDLGLAGAIIRDPALDRRQAGAAVSFMTLSGIAGGLLLAATSGWIETAASLHGLARLLIGFSVVTALSIIATAPRALLERKLEYGKIAAIEGTAMLLGLVSFRVGLSASMGVFSLIVYHIVVQTIRAAAFVTAGRGLFSINAHLRQIAGLVRVGIWLFCTNLLAYAARNAGSLVVGTNLGASALGLYGLASQFMTVPLMLISWPVSGVLMSTLARMQADTRRKGEVICAVIAATTAVSFPLMTFLTFGARFPIEWAYGHRWEGLAGIVALLAPVGAIQSIASYSGAVLVERGAVRLNFALAVVNGVGLSGIFVLSAWLGLHAMMVAYCISALLASALGIYCMCRTAQIGLARFLSSLMPGTVASAAGLAVTFLSKGLAPRTASDWLQVCGIYLLAVLVGFVTARGRIQTIVRALTQGAAQPAAARLPFIFLCGVVAAAPFRTASAADPENGNWEALATAHPTSPVSAEPGDRSIEWVAPDRRMVRVVVKVPRPPSDAATVTLAPVPEGADARPFFEEALERVRTQKAGRLLIPKGTYTFKSLARGRQGHLVVRGLSDVTIDGSGSSLIFTQNEVGIYLTSNERLRIVRLSIDYALHTASLGRLKASPDGNVLVIDAKFPVTASDAVTYVSEYDVGAQRWVPGGLRFLFPTGNPVQAKFVGNQTYTAPQFKQGHAEQSFMIFHHWYGGNAIRISDDPDQPASQDLTLDAVTIHSAPGMGIFVYGMKRGLAIVNSSILKAPGESRLISTEYDGIHLLIAGGDVILANNRISRQGDDAINFNNPVQPIVAVNEGGTNLTLGVYSRFIRVGDRLAFFDVDGNLLGTSQAVSVRGLGGLNNEVIVDAPVAGVTTAAVVRDVQLVNSRYAIQNNTISDCQCHGMLLQVPFGLVEHNSIADTKANAVRLLSNIGFFKEGAGAFEVTVRNNLISGTGTDNAPKMPWAAISVYTAVRDNGLSAYALNGDLEISGNRIENVRQGCISVLNASRVTVSGNTCRAGAATQGVAAISVRNSSSVWVTKNSTSGGFARSLDVDSATTKDIRVQ